MPITAEYQVPAPRATHQRTPQPFPLLLQRRAAVALPKHGRNGLLRVVVLILGDALAVLLAWTLLFTYASSGTLAPLLSRSIHAIIPGMVSSAWRFLLPVLVGLSVFDTYGPGDQRRDLRGVALGISLGLTLSCWAPFFADPSVSALIGAVVVAIVTIAAACAERATIDECVERFGQKARHGVRTLLIGTAEDARGVQSRLRRGSGFEVVGFVDVSRSPSPQSLGGIEDVLHLIEARAVDSLILFEGLERSRLSELLYLADAAGCHLYMLPQSCLVQGLRPALVWRDGTPLIEFNRPALRARQLLMKRAFDTVVAACLLVICAPILAAAAVAVCLSSPGPVFFRQVRIGLGGAAFRIWKFRSMAADAEERRIEIESRSIYSDRRLFKIVGDPRVTRVGAFLRKTSLDELPQLINVLRGEMSLVGPRPPLPAEVELYEDHHYTRFNVRPGLTGPWQVSGRNRLTDFEEIIRLESAYIAQWNIWKDFGILLRTIPAVLRMDEAH